MTEQYPRASKAEQDSCVTTIVAVPQVSLGAGMDTNLVCGKGLTLSFVTMAPHAVGKMHSHPHEQMVVVNVGELDVVLDGKSYALKPGDVLHVPGNLEHSARAHDTECRILEIFTPARKDFEEKLALAKAAKK